MPSICRAGAKHLFTINGFLFLSSLVILCHSQYLNDGQPQDTNKQPKRKVKSNEVSALLNFLISDKEDEFGAIRLVFFVSFSSFCISNYDIEIPSFVLSGFCFGQWIKVIREELVCLFSRHPSEFPFFWPAFFCKGNVLELHYFPLCLTQS